MTGPKRKVHGRKCAVDVEARYPVESESSGVQSENPTEFGFSEGQNGPESGEARATTSVPAQTVRNWGSLRSPAGCAI
jgi:hypothetical protein